MRLFVFLVSLILSLGSVAGCASHQPFQAAKVPDSSTRSLTACQKTDSMWNDKIVPTVYGNLPALTAL